MIHTLTLNPSIDQHVTVAKLVKDDTLRALSVHQDPGGKGINVSRGLHCLGQDTRAFTFTGGHAGRIFEHLLAREKVTCTRVRVGGETRINQILTDLSDRTQTRISMPGPPVDARALKRMARKVASAQAPYWVLGGSLPEGVPADTYRTFIQSLQAKGERCVLDADGEALRGGVEARPFLIKPNEYELEHLVGRPLSDEADILKAAQGLCAQGVGLVAVTLGGRGALVAGPREAYSLKAPPVEARSKVGAGDSFIAGFLNDWVQKGDLLSAACSGVAAGTAAVVKDGTKLFSREDHARFLPLVQWRRLA
ncbi:MAG TPA: 1-phosphofructokinase family hexose kinase [bacterium]|nr:1-phosphofructokinase family hexose kinase [bacterium]